LVQSSQQVNDFAKWIHWKNNQLQEISNNLEKSSKEVQHVPELIFLEHVTEFRVQLFYGCNIYFPFRSLVNNN